MERVAFKEKFDKFLDSWVFVAVIAGIVFAFWALGRVFLIGRGFVVENVGSATTGTIVFQTLGMYFLIALACFIILYRKNLKPFFVIAIYFIFVVSDLKVFMHIEFVVFLCVACPVLAGCLIFYFVKNKPKLEIGTLTTGMAIAMLAVILSGIGFSQTYNLKNIATAFGCGFAVFAFYFLFRNTLYGEIKKYMSIVFIFAGVIMLLQMMYYYGTAEDLMQALNSKSIEVGWGVSNTMSVILLFAMPLSMYLSINSKYNYLYIILTLIFYVGVLLTFARGNILFGTIFMVPTVIYAAFRTRYKRSFLFTFILLFIFIALIISIFYDKLMRIFDFFITTGFSDRGRDGIYSEALRQFKASPLFGIGYFDVENGGPLLYHNSLLQILGCNGIIGLLLYIPFYIQRYYVCIKKISMFKAFALFAIIIYEAYAMLDSSFLMIYQIFFVVALSIACEKETDEDAEPLLLKKNELFVELNKNDNLVSNTCKVKSSC